MSMGCIRTPCTLTAYRVPRTAYRVPRTAYRVPRTAYRVPRTAYRVPLTACRGRDRAPGVRGITSARLPQPVHR
ncbi:hypothetical protein BRM26_19970 [Xanthomonas oryzae pv. oryzae]|nr:hypothetical protein BRM14_16045 [Xanthomonas oryzae pv. oryzae]RBE84451.1 hypothetical protein BRL73_14215 [Xanthomonas oryzae pv. oryzae]RBG83829.1 hypothetical protein BRM26_19970 [Xanthomonas oryzae pv. oryzae]